MVIFFLKIVKDFEMFTIFAKNPSIIDVWKDFNYTFV